MIKKNKAFTIVELVVVIAVISILAAVLIPTFTIVIDKAHKSKDIQQVNSMNTIIDINNQVGEINSLTDALYVIALEGYYYIKPEEDGYQFMWDQENKKILYVDKEYNVLNLEGYNKNDHNNWLSMYFNEEPLENNSMNYSDLFN